MPTHDVDQLAGHLASWARLGKSFPPAWDGAKHFYPISRPGGYGYLGRLLPGKGLLLECDLKEVGITRGKIPFLYEASPARRLFDLIGDEQGAITGYDGIINARANGKADDTITAKVSFTTVANAWSSTYRTAGAPGAGSYTNIPGGAAHDRTTAGALSVGLTNPTNPDLKYLLTFGAVAGQTINMMMLVDLLVACGNITTNSTSPQTINSTALTRYTTGAGVYAIYEVTTGMGAGAPNVTTTYTDQDGNGSSSTGAIALTASAAAQRLLPVAAGPVLQLAAGDYGVRSVETVQMSSSTTGTLALNLYKPLCFYPGVVSNIYAERDVTAQIDGIVELAQTAGGVLGCLTTYILPSTTSSGVITMCMRTCAG